MTAVHLAPCVPFARLASAESTAAVCCHTVLRGYHVACHCECPTGLRFRAPNLRHYKLLLAVDPDQGTEQVVLAGDKLFLWPILRLEDDVVHRGVPCYTPVSYMEVLM